MVCTPLVTGDGTAVAIACGPAQRYRRFYDHCEACGRRRAHARRWDGIYYGYSEFCMGCGTLWQDGFNCGIDRKAAARWWREAEPAAKFDAWVREIERSYFEADE